MSALMSVTADAVDVMRCSTSRTVSSRPPIARLVSSTMVWIWLSPPPLMNSEAAESVSSTVGAADDRSGSTSAPSSSTSVSPGSLPAAVGRAASVPVGAASAGFSTTSTKSSPSAVVVRRRKSAEVAIRVSVAMSIVTTALRSSTPISTTRPTTTPLTLTEAPWARLSASSNVAETR